MNRIQRRIQVLLAVAALGAAGMFQGASAWVGVDVGATGAALLYVALWLIVLHLAWYAGEVFTEEWAPAERQAWVSAVFAALVGFHMINLLAALPELGVQADRLRNPATSHLWVNVGMLLVGWIVVSSILRRQDAGGVALDERDLRIAHGASRFADAGSTLLMLWLVVLLVALPEYSRSWLRPLIAANVLVALLMARALVANIYTVLRYRRERR
jgi:hypothetical protein